MKNLKTPSKGLSVLIYLLNFLTLSTFCFFIYAEISVNILLSGSSFYELIYISLFLAFSLLFFVITIFFQQIILSKNVLLLLLFIGFIAFRALFDFNQISYLLTYTIRSNGGILFYVIAGIVIISQQNFLIKIGHVKAAKQILILTMFLSLILLSSALLQLINNMGQSMFLIKILEGVYQQPANLMIIQILLFQILVSNLKRYKADNILLNLGILILSFLSMLGSQAFGSNTGFVVNLVLLLNYFSIVFISSNKKINFFLKKPINTISPSFLNTYSFYLLFHKQLIYVLFLFIFLAILLFSVFVDYISLFRIFGYGDLSSNSSLDSRLDLIKNFYPQFEISPFFGNLASDRLTTGGGTFPHSLFLSLLTHTGILGTILFILFLGVYLKHIFTIKDSDADDIYLEKIFRYKNIMIILVLLFYSTLATYFTWPPLWFFIGATMGAIKFSDYEKKNISPSY